MHVHDNQTALTRVASIHIVCDQAHFPLCAFIMPMQMSCASSSSERVRVVSTSGLGIKAVGLQRQVTDNEAHFAVAPTVAAFCWICSQPSIATHAQAVRRPARHGCGLAHWKARSFACNSCWPICKQEQGKQRLCMFEKLRPLLRPDYISEHIQYAMLVSCLCL